MSTTEHISPPVSMTREEAVARAKDFAPVVRERASSAEKERRQPLETIQEITDAGLARLLTPRHWGGYELGLDTYVDAVIEIAKGDAAAGWCYSFLNIHAWFLAHFPEEAQHDVWGNTPDVPLAESVIPAGKATPLEGGYLLSGSWPFVSGIDHCKWAMLAGMTPSTPNSPPEPRVFLIPRSDYEIEDTWFVAGLKGSGSKTAVVQGAFVPEHRTVSMIALSARMY
jgi:3-hydroxy-9,10-secoandrosta-1,3,5(10)-triene-9,17-dione monooxygenase